MKNGFMVNAFSLMLTIYQTFLPVILVFRLVLSFVFIMCVKNPQSLYF